MYEISTNTIDGKFRRVDLHSIKINGAFAWDMPLEKLHLAVKNMGVPRVRPEMGKLDLVLRLGIYQQEIEEGTTE